MACTKDWGRGWSLVPDEGVPGLDRHKEKRVGRFANYKTHLNAGLFHISMIIMQKTKK